MHKITKSALCTILSIVLLNASHTIAQEKAYVSDNLIVNFRTGQGNQYRIEKRLRSGTELTVIEYSDDQNWAKVVHSDGTEGWVLNQYLQKQPTAKLRLNDALNKVTTLEAEIARLTEKNKTLIKENREKNTLASKAISSNETMAAELKKIKTISANTIELDRLHQELLEKHQMIQTERDTLLAENEGLKNDNRINYLLYGAALIILGMLISVILPHIKRKKSYTEWK